MTDNLKRAKMKINSLLSGIENHDVNNTPNSLQSTIKKLINTTNNINKVTEEVVTQYKSGWYDSDIEKLLRKNGLN